MTFERGLSFFFSARMSRFDYLIVGRDSFYKIIIKSARLDGNLIWCFNMPAGLF